MEKSTGLKFGAFLFFIKNCRFYSTSKCEIGDGLEGEVKVKKIERFSHSLNV